MNVVVTNKTIHVHTFVIIVQTTRESNNNDFYIWIHMVVPLHGFATNREFKLHIFAGCHKSIKPKNPNFTFFSKIKKKKKFKTRIKTFKTNYAFQAMSFK